MKKSTLRRLYEDACNEMATAEQERDAALAEQDPLCDQVESREAAYEKLMAKFDELTLALSFLLGDNRKNRLVALAVAGAWGFENVRLSRKSRKDLDRILALFDELAEEPDQGWPLQGGTVVVYDPCGPEPDESVRVLFDGSDTDELGKRYLARASNAGWAWQHKPGERTTGWGSGWSATAVGALGPLVDVTSKVT